MTPLALLLVAVAAIGGLFLGRVKASRATAVLSALALLAVSNLLASWPHFAPEKPDSWPQTYLVGLLATGVASVVIHVVPFLLGLYVGKRARGANPHAT